MMHDPVRPIEIGIVNENGQNNAGEIPPKRVSVDVGVDLTPLLHRVNS